MGQLDLNLITKISAFDYVTIHANSNTGSGSLTINLTLPTAGDIIGFELYWDTLGTNEIINSVKIKNGENTKHIILTGANLAAPTNKKHTFLPGQALYKGLVSGDIMEVIVNNTGQSRLVSIAAIVAGDIVTS